MAKSKAQTLTLIQEFARLLDSIHDFGVGDFTTNYDLASAAIAAGDDTPEDVAQTQALAQVLAAFDNLAARAKDLFATLPPTLGRYAGLYDLADASRSLAAFMQKLDDDSEAFKRRGFTKFSSLSADVGNTGDGLFVVAGADVNGDPIDCAHVETVTIECIKDAVGNAATEGSEVFQVRGQLPAANTYEDQDNTGDGAGSGSKQGDYYRKPSGIVGDWNAALAVVRAGKTIVSLSGSSDKNKVLNGGFEATLLSGETTAKITNWTLDANHANVDTDTSNVFVGSQALEISGDFNMTQAIAARVKSRVPMFISVAARKVGTVSAGALTIKIKDDATTHATLTIADLSALTTSFALQTPVTFILPSGIGANLVCEVEVTSWSGAGTVLIDELVVGEMALYDVGYYFAVVRGAAAWRNGDKATGQTTVSEAGNLSRAFNRCLNVAPKAAASATYWSDYS